MAREVRVSIEPGDGVGVIDPDTGRETFRGTVVDVGRGGRTVEVQHPYEWGTRSVAADLVFRTER